MRLDYFDEIPDPKLLSINIRDLNQVLPHPSLIHLKGKVERPVFLSTLLHGNEDTSFEVMQKLCNDYKKEGLPRSLIILVGNPQAAAANVRHLDDQPDFNRIWEMGDSPEQLMARDIYNYARKHQIFASIDLHNNTGNNPHYACINRIDKHFINLARLFSKEIVYFTEPHEVHSMAFSTLCPSLTVECGKTGELEGIDHAYDLMRKVLKSDNSMYESEAYRDAHIFHTVANIKVKAGTSIFFGDQNNPNHELCFDTNFDDFNFKALPRGSRLGYMNGEKSLYVYNNLKDDIFEQFFIVENGEILTKKAFIPSMFTKDQKVIHSDCLGYVMEEFSLPLL